MIEAARESPALKIGVNDWTHYGENKSDASQNLQLGDADPERVPLREEARLAVARSEKTRQVQHLPRPALNPAIDEAAR